MFYNKFISCLYMFRAHVLINRRSNLHYSLWYHHTYRCDDTKARNKLIVKQKFCASSWLITEINSLGKVAINVS